MILTAALAILFLDPKKEEITKSKTVCADQTNLARLGWGGVEGGGWWRKGWWGVGGKDLKVLILFRCKQPQF
jgi:uncharacterized membrane protein